MNVAMDEAALTAFLARVFPQVASEFEVISVAPMVATVRLRVTEKHLRPGGTISGPSTFSLADVSAYIAILAMIGPEALAVTTNCSIDYLRKPAAGRDLISKTRVLKLGKVLVVCDVMVYSEGLEDPVARASLTYSIPPKR
jgi:uncharacterized protein (TIGR00369 family)